jgi:hypothetical protein
MDSRRHRISPARFDEALQAREIEPAAGVQSSECTRRVGAVAILDWGLNRTEFFSSHGCSSQRASPQHTQLHVPEIVVDAASVDGQQTLAASTVRRPRAPIAQRPFG